MHLSMCTRSDIAFALCRAAKRCNNPTEHDYEVIVHIVRYSNGSRDSGLMFRANSHEFEVYTDADWANDKDNRKSVSGVLVRAWGCPGL